MIERADRPVQAQSDSLDVKLTHGNQERFRVFQPLEAGEIMELRSNISVSNGNQKTTAV